MRKRSKPQTQADVSNEPLQSLLDIPDVMRLLKISRPTVYDLFRDGLPYIKFGRAVRISPISLQTFLARREEVA